MRHAINFFLYFCHFLLFSFKQKKMVYPTISISLFFLDCDTQNHRRSMSIFLQSSFSCESQAVILLRICEYSFNRFLTQRIDIFPQLCIPYLFCCFQIFCPYMSCHYLCIVSAFCTFISERTFGTCFRITFILPVSLTVYSCI